MNDLISRQAAIFAILECCDSDFADEYECGYDDGLRKAVHKLKHLPAAQPERKKGKWVKQNPFVDTEECSLCKYNIYSKELETPFCPWCGAEMEGSENEETN